MASARGGKAMHVLDRPRAFRLLNPSLNLLFIMVSLIIYSFMSGCNLMGERFVDRSEVIVTESGPPSILEEDRPRLIFASGFGVYFAPDLEVDLYFDRGIWFYLHNKTWYESADYRGPWSPVHVKHIPRGLRNVPPGQLRSTFKKMEAREKLKD
jgi:hypothetical protein